MSNVIQLAVPSRILPLEARITALLGLFAEHRRTGDDVFWLKENGEMLNILQSTGLPVPGEALAVHAGFYANAAKRLQFFPQYYRFLLSLALDLEDLGMPGQEAEKMVHYAAQEGLVDAEMSDLQRAEARRLMTRRGVDPVRDTRLDDRLRAFVSRTKTFALPNKKAAYELTHIVFYLTQYGHRQADLGPDAVTSLHFAGLTAFLDQNADLLAEICIAMRFLGEVPPPVWTGWLRRETAAFTVEEGETVSINDNYHDFLICNWHEATCGGEAFRKPLSGGRMRFEKQPHHAAALREISQAMLALDDARVGDWSIMKRRMADTVSEEALGMLEVAATTSDHFEAYFEGFARAGTQ
ncbi:DUF6902 family protein [Pacificoceanicola onchidii]|uniref:DUF6902 family protein n=1 Tax=Pacificoceanicola onchidii TaxID=2562685 RepID=UPI0010A30719|nr:hypothetical protein [Pacificoceanicola onchidii]